MIVRNEATERQVNAARPNFSTWLAANAGSGKTRVLTDRVARLLLEKVRPEHILCLTYTKAAASEMQNRLFKRLGEWSMLGDQELADALVDLGVDDTLNPERLGHARTLFARAIETPGGLKIQTIHSFCASLLRRFPLEAGVSPQFTEMEDRAAALLQAEIIEDFAEGPMVGLIDELAAYVTDTGFEELTKKVVHHREEFDHHLVWNDLIANLGLPAGADENHLESVVFTGNEKALLERLVNALKNGSSTDIKNSVLLRDIASPSLNDLPVLEGVFLTGASAKSPFSAKLGSFPTKAVREANTELMGEVERFMQRVEEARQLRLGLECARKTVTLHKFAAAFLPEYARRKELRGWLDFDDLILKARRLLNDPSVAQWVLYRLDGGIDHILVDEAQDTSPEQWDVIENLAREFTSGQGARTDIERTIFVVGDKKQSIYSFQGADPEAFDRMQAEFGRRLEGVDPGLQNLTLAHSFRSSPAILNLVDLVFEGRTEAGFHKDALHKAFNTDLPGRVDLWPVTDKIEDNDDRVWTDPVDRASPLHHNVILAEKIAETIKRLIESKETLPIKGETSDCYGRRPVQPGDFLILVQRRSDLFAEIIRACKTAGLPIAGADRLKVGAELAVKDLAALLSFLATPEDSLSLAVALKSPLFGWTEQDLFDLAHRRESKHLWPALRERAQEFPQTMAILTDLRANTDFLRPFDLIERILTRHDGRRKLLERLGAEAEDGINALLSQALAYERTDVPSLTGFLVWMETDDLEIKRQMGSAGNMVRVMTVHGAKGLESPIVILPDTGTRRASPDSEIMTIGDVPYWRMKTDQMPDAMIRVRDNARDRQMNERLRLLYVALTRAEKWLIVAAAGDLSKTGDSWYQMVESAMQRAGAQQIDASSGLRLSHLGWNDLPIVDGVAEIKPKNPLPTYFHDAVVPPKEQQTTLSPSDLGGAKALAGDLGQEEEAAKLRGTRIHTLLEHLPVTPEANWVDATLRLLPDVGKSERGDLLDEVQGTLKSPLLEYVFDTGTLAEIPISAEIHGVRMHGLIDRLVITKEGIQAIDFKTNLTVPKRAEDCPEGLLRQMGAYGEMLKQVYPDREINTAILWTRIGKLMPLPTDLVAAALLRSPRLDVDTGRS